MYKLNCRGLMVCASLLMWSAILYPGLARGEFSMLAGEFDGGEPKIDPWDYCASHRPASPYQKIGFSVTLDGTYSFANAFSSFDWDGNYPGFGLDLEGVLYAGEVDAAQLPQGERLLDFGDSDRVAQVDLEADTTYSLFLMYPCYEQAEAVGSWAFVINGPGAVQSAARHEIPETTTGIFSSMDARVNGRCGIPGADEIPYKQLGPFKVASSGRHYFSDVAGVAMVDACQAIYSAPLDPSNIEANLVGRSSLPRPDYSSPRTRPGKLTWQVDLLAGTDYWLVVQPRVFEALEGSYVFVHAASAQFRINPGHTGLWADSATPGQGMYLDVFNSIDKVFMAWFTYDLQLPVSGAGAMLGDPGHRWLTGLGDILGNHSEVDAIWTSGGLFDSHSSQLSRNAAGQVRLEFDSCTSGRAIYQLSHPALNGVVQLRRPFEDAEGIRLCEQFLRGPGIPGPF